MKKLIALLALFGATSCQSLDLAVDTGDYYRALEVHGAVGQLEEANQYTDDDPVLAGGARILVQPDNPNLIGDNSEPNRPLGLVGLFGVSFAKTGATAGGQDLDINYGQLDMGLRYYFETWIPWFQPYIDTTFALRRYITDVPGGDVYDTTKGFVGRVGVEFPVGHRGRFGVGYQLSAQMETDEGGIENDLDDNVVYGSFTWVF